MAQDFVITEENEDGEFELADLDGQAEADQLDTVIDNLDKTE